MVLVDPVLADDGELYGTIGGDLHSRDENLVKKADVITPNFTEACLDEEYNHQ